MHSLPVNSFRDRKSRTWFCQSILLVIVLLPIVGHAALSDDVGDDDFMLMSLDQLTSIKVDMVYGASKHVQTTTEAPSSVTVVTRRNIEAHAPRNLADILNGVRGFYTSYDRGYRNIGVRGFSRPGDFGGRVLLALEGHRLNDATYDTAASSMDFILDVGLIERVEVIRGPGSSLYGNNAFFGVVNVIPRRGGSVDGVELALTAGGLDTQSARLTWGKEFESGLDILISGSQFDSGGNERLSFPEYVAEGLDGEEATSAFTSISYGDFTLQGGYVRRLKDWPVAAYDTVPNSQDPRFYSMDERSFVSLGYAGEMGDDWSVKARTYFDHYQFDGDYPWEYDEDPLNAIDANHDFAQSRSMGIEFSASSTVLERNRITLGLDWRHDLTLEQKNFDVGWEDDPYLDIDETANTTGVFVQDEWQPGENFILNTGLRYDHHDAYDGRFAPRVAGIYMPQETTALKLIYGNAFRAPNAYERDYADGEGFIVNPDLKPETVSSYELVWEQSLGEHWQMSLSGYQNEIKSLIELKEEPDPDSVDDYLYFFDNTATVDSTGMEFEIETALENGIQAVASYAWARVHDSLTDHHLTNSPHGLGKLGVTIPFSGETFLLGLEVQTMSSRATVEGNSADGFTIANLTLFSRKLIRDWEISAAIYNLFDTSYSDPVSSDFAYTGPQSGEYITLDTVEQDGRTFRVKLVAKF